MSEVALKVRNNPNSFAKESEITNELCACKINDSKSVTIELIQPKNAQPYDRNGRGGIPLFYNKANKLLYVDHTDKHSLVIGSTGSKKSRLLAMPTIITLGAASESMIISDPKAELFSKTSKYLKNLNYNVVAINLRDPQYGFAWNPLAIPYKWFLDGDIDRAYEFANDIAINLTSTDKSNSDPFWDNSAGSFFFGLILLLFKYCKDYNLPRENVNIGNIMRLRDALCSGNWLTNKNSPWWQYAKTDSFITSTLIGTIETANDTRAGILSVFDQKMRSLAIQPSLMNMLAQNDIDYDLITEKPTAIFLIVPDEKTGFHGLVSLFIKQSYEYLVYKAQMAFENDVSIGCRVNYILDEFSALPTINDFPAMITAARSRNIRFNLFLQSKHQLKLRYREEADTIMANCENWIFLASREIEFLHEMSELCGDAGNSQGKPVLTTSELQRLDKIVGEVLVLHGRFKPFISNLADIDELNIPLVSSDFKYQYDKRSYPMWSQIDFKSKERIEEILDVLPYKNHMELSGLKKPDDLIKEIDRKIAELEQEEQLSTVTADNKFKKGE
ncbi:MAG: type IV secretory system conjugative DNA transfer family protein [Lachnospiraceae bacterium]|nr:type IV secretory system conjugative DNA transfer family protein [Lachnospiraceae bacterium]